MWKLFVIIWIAESGTPFVDWTWDEYESYQECVDELVYWQKLAPDFPGYRVKGWCDDVEVVEDEVPND